MGSVKALSWARIELPFDTAQDTRDGFLYEGRLFVCLIPSLLRQIRLYGASNASQVNLFVSSLKRSQRGR